MSVRRFGPLLAVLPPLWALAVAIGVAWSVPTAMAATSGPSLQLRSDQALSPVYAQGIARVSDGWIVSGTNLLARLDEHLAPTRTVVPAIPAEWAAKGYNHIGDIDVVGRYIYAPFEQPDYTLDRQATARYDARTLRFIDARELPQHENSFVTVDPSTQIAYSMDRFGGDRLLRYDIGNGWRALPPLGLGQTLERVQGADVAAGAIWLSTDDARKEVYRADLRTGALDELGSAGHTDGEGEGIDASLVGASRLHVMVIDRSLIPVHLVSFAVVGLAPPVSRNDSGSGWPPVLVMGALALVVAGVGAGGVLLYRAWVGIRAGSGRA